MFVRWRNRRNVAIVRGRRGTVVFFTLLRLALAPFVRLPWNKLREGYDRWPFQVFDKDLEHDLWLFYSPVESTLSKMSPDSWFFVGGGFGTRRMLVRLEHLFLWWISFEGSCLEEFRHLWWDSFFNKDLSIIININTLHSVEKVLTHVTIF